MALVEPALLGSCFASSNQYQYFPNVDIAAFDLQVLSGVNSICDCATQCANYQGCRSASPISGNVNVAAMQLPNQPTTASTADLCLDRCSKTSGCLYINYDLSNSNCFLNQGYPKSNNIRNLGFGVNYRTCGTQIVVPGQDIPGYDLGRVGFTTSCDCAARRNLLPEIIPNKGTANSVDELLQGPISLDSPKSCINLCKQTTNCLFVNFQITNAQTAAVSCTLKKGFAARGFQASLGFSVFGSGSIPLPVGVTTVVPEQVPPNTAVPGGSGGNGGNGGGVANTESTFSLGGVVGATSNLPTPTLVSGGSGGNTNGGQGSGGNGSNGGQGNGGSSGSGNSGNGGTNASSSSSSFPVIAVAGGVGGVVLVAGIIAGILVYRRRSARNGKDGNAGGLNEFGGESGGVSSKVITSAPLQGPVALRQQQLNEDFKSNAQDNNEHLPVWSQQQQQQVNNTNQQQSHTPLQPPQQQPHQYTPYNPLGSTTQHLTPPSRGSSSTRVMYPSTDSTTMDKLPPKSDGNLFTVSSAVHVMNGDYIGYGNEKGSYPVDSKSGFMNLSAPTHALSNHAVGDNNDLDADALPPSYPGTGV
ncbi:hypothetical protein HDU76_006903 [Blyttiomyces sp. JEL0837]|nr:hypothetical protein HDU76_006903 [Blyttiomyces sp. JEL0837]